MKANAQLKTVKLINNQYNLVHYHQYYDFETLNDIKNDIEKKYKPLYKKLLKNSESYTMQFEKFKNLKSSLSDLPNNATIHYLLINDKNDHSSNNSRTAQ